LEGYNPRVQLAQDLRQLPSRVALQVAGAIDKREHPVVTVFSRLALDAAQVFYLEALLAAVATKYHLIVGPECCLVGSSPHQERYKSDESDSEHTERVGPGRESGEDDDQPDGQHKGADVIDGCALEPDIPVAHSSKDAMADHPVVADWSGGHLAS
jgi:hypothetical protein